MTNNSCWFPVDVKYQNKQNSAMMGAQWLSGRVLDLRPKGRRFKSHRHHCVVSLSKGTKLEH